jgi:hypothetical protein
MPQMFRGEEEGGGEGLGRGCAAPRAIAIARIARCATASSAPILKSPIGHRRIDRAGIPKGFYLKRRITLLPGR